VSEVAHRLVVTLDAAGYLRLDPLQSRVREVKRNADERRSLRTTPLIAQIDGRSEGEPFGLEFSVKLIDEALDTRAAD